MTWTASSTWRKSFGSLQPNIRRPHQNRTTLEHGRSPRPPHLKSLPAWLLRRSRVQRRRLGETRRSGRRGPEVRVRDAELLAKYLGRPTAAAIAQRARGMGPFPVAATGEPWVTSLLEQMTANWARGESYHRLKNAGQTVAAKEFLSLLAAVSRQEAEGLDARTFSLRTTATPLGSPRLSAPG